MCEEGGCGGELDNPGQDREGKGKGQSCPLSTTVETAKQAPDQDQKPSPNWSLKQSPGSHRMPGHADLLGQRPQLGQDM